MRVGDETLFVEVPQVRRSQPDLHPDANDRRDTARIPDPVLRWETMTTAWVPVGVILSLSVILASLRPSHGEPVFAVGRNALATPATAPRLADTSPAARSA
jgi:hypothetical protein